MGTIIDQLYVNLDLGREKHAFSYLYVTKDEKGDIFSRYWSKSVIRNIRTGGDSAFDM